MKITIKREDFPKVRDLDRVSIIERKKGAHKDRKKDANKKSCRGKVKK